MSLTAEASTAPRVDFDGPYRLSIDGELTDGPGTFDVFNPATGEVLAQAPSASAEQMDTAIAAAKRAFTSWSALSWEERAGYITRYADALDAHRDELARLLTLEQGKPLATQAAFETDLSLSWVRDTAKRALPVETIEDTDEHVVQLHHTPLGVVGAITPWNFPILLGLWKVAPCLLTGNTMVLKPSPYTPLTSLRFGEIAQAVLPPGVLNVVSGDNDLGTQMTSSPDIAKISFTGSTATGRKVMESGSVNLKRMTLELGGNDAAIVLPGADVSSLVPTLFDAAYGNSGQWCIAVKRLYVHESLHREFVDAFVAHAATKKVGDGLDPETDLGPIQNTMQYEKLVDLFDDIRDQGYSVPLGGTIDRDRPGNFVPVTVVDDPPDDSRIVTEEPFGPVLPILSFSSVDEVVRRANDTEFGLGGSVWGPAEDAASVALRLETGTVWVNEIHIHGVDIPFGGHKQSGMGVEHGSEGLAEFTNTKTLMFRK